MLSCCGDQSVQPSWAFMGIFAKEVVWLPTRDTPG